MAAPDKILKLVQRFTEQRATYMSGSYNETQVRIDFIDPFFKELGWDIDNENDYAEAYRDVIHEDMVMVGTAKKAPDYSFRVGGMRKFFVEAKKPSVSISLDPKPAFQLRRYGWSAKLPISILTDFEEFAVYDCSHKPDETHAPTKARLHYFKYTEYAEKWDEIAALFSKQAVMKGSFDRFADGKKKGTTTVDEEFLAEIEEWRQSLASNILKNNDIAQRDLNLAVQLIIDRIIFLRICEDRGIEDYERLSKLTKAKDLYRNLTNFFVAADYRYNSGLFHFNTKEKHATPADAITLKLKLDDAPLKIIIESLYPPNPYEFSVIPADILGQVYERFLGKVIQVDGKKAVIEEKPEVKKAGGVFYTPSYIVEYIVKHTVDSLLEGKTPKQVEKIKIVDPACGSGSFLIVAYQHLLDWHLNYYTANGGITKFKKELQETQTGMFRLTTQIRKAILLHNIYGVDIDAQAVEVTKLSLLLKVLEGESGETIGKNLSLFHERALPDLGNNIKRGNSLVSSDIIESISGIVDGDFFDWEDEFSSVFDNGGFDVVIGNPPWVSLKGKFGADILSPEHLKYLVTKYNGNTYMPNLYEFFVHKGIDLIKDKGVFSFIIPDRLLMNEQFIKLRSRILTTTKIQHLVLRAPFPGVTVDTLIFIVQGGPSKGNKVVVEEYQGEKVTRPQSDFIKNTEYVIDPITSPASLKVWEKISKNKTAKKLGSLVQTTSGFGGKSEEVTQDKCSPAQIKIYKGQSIGKYEVKNHYWFEFKKENITGRTTDKAKLGWTKKILIRKTGNGIIAALDETGNYPEQSLYFLFKPQKVSEEYILGLLNSKLMTYLLRSRYLTNAGSIAQIKNKDLDDLPIVLPDETIASKVEALVKQITSNKQSNNTKVVKALDQQLDKLVYALYGLDTQEISIVEGQV